MNTPTPQDKEQELREQVVELTSLMLENPNGYGIYPTTKFYNSLLSLITAHTALAEVKARKDEVDTMIGFNKVLYPGAIPPADVALSMPKAKKRLKYLESQATLLREQS